MNAALLTFAALSIDCTPTSMGSVDGRITRNGREFAIISTPSRTYLHACNTAPERADGYEVARAYGAPDVAIPAVLARL